MCVCVCVRVRVCGRVLVRACACVLVCCVCVCTSVRHVISLMWLLQVQAMKRHGKELEDRWDRIAAEVPGKSKAQCLKRFKALRSTFRAQQAAA